MKPLAAVTSIALAASAAGRAIRAPTFSTAVTTSSILPTALHLRELQFNNVTMEASTVFAAADGWGFKPDGLTPEQKEAVWCKAKSRGSSLTKAMMVNDQEAATVLKWPYTQSIWDGDLRPELKKWGYKEINNENPNDELDIDKECDFDRHELTDAFKELRVDTRPAGKGGPNHCFYVEHMNGPTIIPDGDGDVPEWPEDQYYEADGKKYRVTEGYAKVGVNANDGLVYFIHRQSPEDAAREHWDREPSANELPALRASSDITWGMWNRVAQGSRNLDYFLSVSIVNPETDAIMERALQQFGMAKVPRWPGQDFEFAKGGRNPSEGDLEEMEAALALLGSPNGLAAGYFLVQHRRQLGWKYIWKAKIWMAGQGEYAHPNLLLYVSDRAPIDGTQTLDDRLSRLHIAQKRKRDLAKAQKEGIVVHKSSDGKNLIREHRIVAKL